MSKAQQASNKKTAAKTYFNYIGGEWVKSSSGEWFENVNPADSNDVVGRFPLSNADDVNRAVDAAKSAATRWRKTPAPKRAEILFD
jgi:NAD-dependent aldehyde dehydrogenases